ncbi:hypothetical protein COB21_03180 [Candidatus Aerophobetes bacterium]|uniref:Heptosyltransferase n=1 Tax=Aerophobetes bacterium TaxID=2030807 RepID=A0A2A4X487_UNCAE|nr:MAG: hypothetical protein COB21_03180 [Candidatus Aerophobetes bacterium]
MHKLAVKCKAFFINPLDALLKKAHRQKKSRFLIVWNRGLGDIALGLYALVCRIKQWVPHANIVFITRADLSEGFALLEGVSVLVDSSWERGKPFNLDAALHKHNLEASMFDVVIEKPDPTRWVKWQLGKLTPKLKWDGAYNARSAKFSLDKSCVTYIGVHLDSETGNFYGYNKNWDMANWKELFSMIAKNKNVKILLFGMKKTTTFFMDNIIDLRGDTDLISLIATIKNYCAYLVAPDSGVLAMAYYLDEEFPLKVVSLWSDTRQGILKQKVASPNAKLVHIPLVGKNENINNITPKSVYEALQLET